MKAHKWLKWWLVVLTAAATAWMLAGCDDDDDDGGSNGGGTVVDDGGGDGDGSGGDGDGTADAVTDSVNIAGVWNGTRSSDEGSAGLQFFFEQSGNTLSGDYHDLSGFEGHFTGSIDGDDIQLTLTLTAGWPGGGVWTFTGAVNAGGNHIVGHMNTGVGVDDIDATR